VEGSRAKPGLAVNLVRAGLAKWGQASSVAASLAKEGLEAELVAWVVAEECWARQDRATTILMAPTPPAPS